MGGGREGGREGEVCYGRFFFGFQCVCFGTWGVEGCGHGAVNCYVDRAGLVSLVGWLGRPV